jgi:hypothetical protein
LVFMLTDLNYQRMIIGYHGCDAGVVAKVLSGEELLAPSEQDYDWLGHGIYFWEQGPQRAYDWAKEEAKRLPEKIKTPAVLGAYINLGQCFDLLDTFNTEILKASYLEFCRVLSENGKPLPQNKGVIRNLDCAVINWSLDYAKSKTGRVFQSVRGVFVEGESVYPGTQIALKSHIQIAVRDPNCIIGFFKPNANSYST